MNTLSCDITVVLDRSGSMQSVRQDTIGGFNAFLGEQRKLPGQCTVSMVQFDDQYEPLYSGKPVQDAPPLSADNFVPRGMTALLDAIGRTINETGRRLAAMPEAHRPGKVLFVILTDGGENSSKEFTRQQVFDMIGHQKSVYSWDFVFLGANQDAISVGRSLNIADGSAMTYAANPVGTQAAFASASAYASQTRSGAQGSFSDEDRRKQEQAGAKA
jgi:hypothetical protein